MMNKEVEGKIGLSKYLKNGVIDTPDSCTKICVDVGLSETAPNSAVWMLNDPKRCVVGIEPLGYNWERLEGKHDHGKNFTAGWPAVRINPCGIYVGNKIIIDIPNKFYGLRCAIDNISHPEEKTFYHMVNEGGSSLLKPSDKNDDEIKKIETVQCVSLKSVLNHIDWTKFKVIEHLKVDCEGHDLEVIKSAQGYLDKIIFITFEMSKYNRGHWHGHYDFKEAEDYMLEKDFEPVAYDGGNITYLNNRFIKGSHMVVSGWKRYITELFGTRNQTPVLLSPELGQVYACDILDESDKPTMVSDKTKEKD